MDKLYNMAVFVKVVDMGSFTAVAQHLDTTVGNVSRAVSLLEQSLNARLLHRSTRRLVVSDAGRRFYDRSVSILADVAQAEAEANDALLAPRGTLRVHAVPGLGRELVTHAVLEYQQTYPDVSVNLILSQRMPNLLEEQLDVAIVIARTLPDSAYVSQKLGESHCVLAASPDYLAKHPPLERPEDLADHACVQLSTVDYVPDEWQLKCDTNTFSHRPAGTYFSVNDMEAMATALKRSAGVGLLAGYVARDYLRTGTLIRVLPRFHTQARNVYALYASRQFVDAKVTRFVDILKETTGTVLHTVASELDIPST